MPSCNTYRLIWISLSLDVGYLFMAAPYLGWGVSPHGGPSWPWKWSSSSQSSCARTAKCKKAKWLSEEVLQTAAKRREAKSKGEKERYTHLNAEFQRIERRDKKAFLNDQCKEIEENNRMGKTRDLFKKIRDTKGTFHAKMGSIKDRNGMDQQKQKILRRGGKDTQKNCTKKIFMIQIVSIVWSLT